MTHRIDTHKYGSMQQHHRNTMYKVKIRWLNICKV